MAKKFCLFLAGIGKGLLKPFFPLTVYGSKKIPDKKCIIVANHLSGWDPIIFTLGTKGVHPFVYKAEFRKSAFLRWAFDGLDCIPVKRGDVDLAASRQIIEMLDADKSVALFPEGTRNPNIDCLQKFRTGAALFALKTRSPILPYYIWDKTKAFHRNYIIIGEEFTLEEFYDRPLDKQTLNEATEVIKQKVDELRVKLNGILAEKGVKRRKRTKKEIERTEAYNRRQQNLQKRLAEEQNAEVDVTSTRERQVNDVTKTDDSENKQSLTDNVLQNDLSTARNQQINSENNETTVKTNAADESEIR